MELGTNFGESKQGLGKTASFQPNNSETQEKVIEGGKLSTKNQIQNLESSQPVYFVKM